MKNKKRKIELSGAVAGAICSLLFDREGIDMTPVIDALSANKSRSREAVAITTALLMKGIDITPTTETRYKLEESSYSNDPKVYVKQYTYEQFAPYDDRVYFKSTIMYSEAQKGKNVSDLSKIYQVGYKDSGYMDENSWENLLEFDELPKEIQNAINGENAFSEMCKIVDPE